MSLSPGIYEALLDDGLKSVKQIADALQRQPGVIRSRLAKLNLIDPQTPGGKPLALHV